MTIGIRYLPDEERRAYHRRANRRSRERGSPTRPNGERTDHHRARQRSYWRRWIERKRALLQAIGIEPTRKNVRLYDMRQLATRIPA